MAYERVKPTYPPFHDAMSKFDCTFTFFSYLILAMAQGVSRRLVTPEARIPPLVSPCGVCFGQNGTGTGFPPSRYCDILLSVTFRQSCILILTYLLLVPEEQTVETSEPSKRKVLSEFGKHWIEDYLHFSPH